MSTQILKMIGGVRKIPLEIATEIVVKGQVVAKRIVSAIDPRILEITAQKVEAAYNGEVMFTPAQKAEMEKVVITSMPHDESPMDPNSHITIYAQLKGNPNPVKAHCTINPSAQQPARP